MKKISQYLTVPPFVPCENCSGGWVVVENQARRCECWRAWMDKVLALTKETR